MRESDAALVHLGDQADVRVPAYPGEVFHANIAYVSSVIDPSTHRLVIGAQIHNANDRLKPNMAASFNIQAGQAADLPAVPQSAVVYEGDAARVGSGIAWAISACRRVAPSAAAAAAIPKSHPAWRPANGS